MSSSRSTPGVLRYRRATAAISGRKVSTRRSRSARSALAARTSARSACESRDPPRWLRAAGESSLASMLSSLERRAAKPIAQAAQSWWGKPHVDPRVSLRTRWMRPCLFGALALRCGVVSLRVVIGEDEPIMREGLVHVLAEADLDVVGAAGDATDLVRKALAHRPDIVITDIQMPPDRKD